MNAYELISPKSLKPCGVFACGVCNKIVAQEFAEKCCQPCSCGKPSRNRFEAKCSDCWDNEYHARRMKQLEEAELVEWDGESMIFTEEVSGYRDGWFDSPEDLYDHCADEEGICPYYAFVGRKMVNKLDIDRAVSQMTEDTYEDAEMHVSEDDWNDLLQAVEKFNSKYAVVYYEHDYSKKVRIRE